MSPAELQINRKFCTRLDLLKIKLGAKVSIQQKKQATFFNGNRKIDFKIGDVVMAKDIRKNCWKRSKIIDKLSPVTFNVQTSDNMIWKRHSDQLNPCNLDFKIETDNLKINQSDNKNQINPDSNPISQTDESLNVSLNNSVKNNNCNKDVQETNISFDNKSKDQSMLNTSSSKKNVESNRNDNNGKIVATGKSSTMWWRIVMYLDKQ